MTKAEKNLQKIFEEAYLNEWKRERPGALVALTSKAMHKGYLDSLGRPTLKGAYKFKAHKGPNFSERATNLAKEAEANKQEKPRTGYE